MFPYISVRGIIRGSIPPSYRIRTTSPLLFAPNDHDSRIPSLLICTTPSFISAFPTVTSSSTTSVLKAVRATTSLNLVAPPEADFRLTVLVGASIFRLIPVSLSGSTTDSLFVAVVVDSPARSVLIASVPAASEGIFLKVRHTSIDLPAPFCVGIVISVLPAPVVTVFLSIKFTGNVAFAVLRVVWMADDTVDGEVASISTSTIYPSG